MFSGIGGFDLGFNRNGLECVGYSEIDKYAIQIYEKNFGKEIKNYGDATKINAGELPDFDILCGGFPCQSFSIAGKRRGFEDTRGTMFFEIARILEVKRPSYFVLENVKGLLSHDKGKTFTKILQTLDELGYNFEWMVLNSKFFGVPQNRERVFIIGYLGGKPRPEILPFTTIDRKNNEESKKTIISTITSRYYKTGNADPYILRLNNPKHSNDTIYSEEGISPSLNTAQGGNRQPKIIQRIPLKFLERNQKNIEGDYSFTVDSANTGGIKEGNTIRRLTPLECERLQGFPDNWTEGLSDTQRYKVLGNAVSVCVIEKIIKNVNVLYILLT